MLLKLAVRNIRRSVRDYSLYFVTLLFGVAVFYAFNSIGSQSILFDIESQASQTVFETTQRMLNIFSWLVAAVLGFLIVYANRFLIKRRKHEFGIYLTLGMGPGAITRIVLYETLLVGCASLAVGLVAGVVLSQGLSFVTAGLFSVTMSNYQFVFSPDALVTTLGCFAIIYVVVALFNLVTVQRYQLIDLLRASAKNEKVAVRNPWVCLAAFVVAVALLAVAYQQLIESGLVMLDDPRFLRATVLMLVGTLVLFWALAGFVIGLLTRAPGAYLRGLVPFTTRQLASKVNTAFLSLWAVCIMLFFSITVFSTGMGLVEVFTTGMEKANPYSATLQAAVWYGPDGSRATSSGDPLERRAEMAAEAPERLAQAEAYDWDMAAALRDAAPELWDATVAQSAQINGYSVPDELFGPLLDAASAVAGDAVVANAELASLRDQHVAVFALSEFNAVRALVGQPAVELAPGECAMVNNLELSQATAEAIAKAQPALTVGGYELAYGPKVYDTQLEDNAMTSTALYTVVPDEAVDELRAQGVIPEIQFLDVMYADNGKTATQNDEALAQAVAALQPAAMGGFDKGTAGAGEPYASLLWPVSRIITADAMMAQSAGLRLMITYLAVYIGFVLLISTAAVLAIQQLSEAADSQPRYRALSRLGCDAPMLNRSLFVQTLVYFLLPLVVAVCHSACAIGVMADSLFEMLGVPVQGPILMAAALVLVVYGSYFALTYAASRGIVRQAVRQG